VLRYNRACSYSSFKLKLLVFRRILPAVMEFLMDVQVWLGSLGLEQYARNFRDHAIDSRLLVTLTANDLRDLGVNLVGHRRKLLDESPEGLSPSGAPRTVHDPLESHGSRCSAVAMT
jgi:hypothetical protein